MGVDPELIAEQQHVDRSYRRLDELRAEAEMRLKSVLGEGRGGTHQFREERDVIVRTSLARIEQLDIGDQPLCFGRVDRLAPESHHPDAGSPRRVEKFHIGRLGISGDDLDPLVVDWRAPIAEPFYRATGRDPMGLILRRHIAASGRTVTAIEDERFAVEDAASGGENAANSGNPDELELGGPGALLAAIEGVRTGQMRDIVATIQHEQDAIIRSPLLGVLVVQGGPGTGKTAVALHRAAYLLYTHRFPLERQGVLVIGPNPLFLRYIERVLPSLGETGVTLSTIGGLLTGTVASADESDTVARLKGDVKMAKVIARAVRTRQRPLRKTAEIPFGFAVLRVTPELTATIVNACKRRPGSHNARRRVVEQMLVTQLAEQYQRLTQAQVAKRVEPEDQRSFDFDEDDPDELMEREFDLAGFSKQIKRTPEMVEVLHRIWPRLSAEELLHDLFGSQPLLSLAGGDSMELRLLARPRAAALSDVRWTAADLALIDEARVLLGPRRAKPPQHARADDTIGSSTDEPIRSYGHIVVDEAQDLSPMQLRMVSRRSLSGSVTVVGDIAQATSPWAPGSWAEVTAHLPDNRPPRLVELSVSYRTPTEVAEVANRVLREAAPDLRPPRSVRRSGFEPLFIESSGGRSLDETVAEAARDLVERIGGGTAAVLAPSSCVAAVAVALDAAGLHATDPRREGLGSPLSLLPADLISGLEFDGVLVVEPAMIIRESAQGLRSLYVALTRPTRQLVVVHSEPLPGSLRGID